MPIVLTPIVDTRQSVSFNDIADELSVHLPGCPAPMIVRSVRKVITDMCQRAKVWHEEFVAVSLVPNQAAYPLVPPVSYATCTDITEGYTVIDGQKKVLTWEKIDAVKRAYPSWPEGAYGAPQYMTLASLGQVLLAPTPDTTGDLFLRGYLRPSANATQWDADLYNEFSRVVFHGVLYDMMLVTGRPWANEKLAALHGKHWTQLLASARDRATRGYNTDGLAVEMRPFA